MRKADNLPPYCAFVTKCGSLDFSEPCGPGQACYGTASPLPYEYRPNLFQKGIYNVQLLQCCTMNLCFIQSGAAVPYGVRRKREREREREKEKIMEGNV